MILARTVAHTTDVDGMLHGMTRQQFNEWFAMWTMKPWDVGFTTQETEETKPASSLDAMRRVIGV